MPKKPKVKIENWRLEDMGDWVRLIGDAKDHPLLGSQCVYTSKIKSIITQNTEYILGEKANGAEIDLSYR